MSNLDLSITPLGKSSAYVEQYDAALLCPIPRAPMRRTLGLPEVLPFVGADFWTAYEVSWLNPKGKPVVALAYLTIPAESACIVESKSLKLYFNSFNQTVFDDDNAVKTRITNDLTAAVWHGQAIGAQVGVLIKPPQAWEHERITTLEGTLLDRLDISVDSYQPCPEALRADHSQAPVTETLVSDLLKSNCMVTGQPDWASVQITYSGAPIDHEGLLRYIIGMRQHNEFHEPCVEHMFWDIWQHCKPLKLSVYARYTRRGGLDINPWRSSHPQLPPPRVRTARQ